MAGATDIGQEHLNVPFPQMVKSMGVGIAQAQYELDLVGMRLAQMMSGEYEVDSFDSQGNLEFEIDGTPKVEKRTALIEFGGEKLSLLELGFTPTFYQFVDTIIEVKMSISMSRSTESKQSSSQTNIHAKARLSWWSSSVSSSVSVSSVSASFASKYQYSAEGSSLLRTKLVPVPPPSVLEERIRLLLEEKKASEA